MALIDFLFELPLWLLGIVLNAWLMGFALTGLWIARRWLVPWLRLRYDDAYYAAALVQSAMLLGVERSDRHQLVQQRRQRLDSVQSGLPGVLWFVLFAGAMGCIVMCLLFQVDNARFQAILLLAVAGFLTMVLFVIVALDRPFVGEMGLAAEPYQLIHDHHMKR